MPGACPCSLAGIAPLTLPLPLSQCHPLRSPPSSAALLALLPATAVLHICPCSPACHGQPGGSTACTGLCHSPAPGHSALAAGCPGAPPQQPAWLALTPFLSFPARDSFHPTEECAGGPGGQLLLLLRLGVFGKEGGYRLGKWVSSCRGHPDPNPTCQRPLHSSALDHRAPALASPGQSSELVRSLPDAPFSLRPAPTTVSGCLLPPLGWTLLPALPTDLFPPVPSENEVLRAGTLGLHPFHF